MERVLTPEIFGEFGARHLGLTELGRMIGLPAWLGFAACGRAGGQICERRNLGSLDRAVAQISWLGDLKGAHGGGLSGEPTLTGSDPLVSIRSKPRVLRAQ